MSEELLFERFMQQYYPDLFKGEETRIWFKDFWFAARNYGDTGLEGVVNLSRLLGIQENLNRFGLLAHGGIKIDAMTSKTANVFENDHNNGATEWNGGLVIGITPQFRITQKLAVMLDVSVQNNYRQHFNWDGSYSDISNLDLLRLPILLQERLLSNIHILVCMEHYQIVLHISQQLLLERLYHSLID